MEPACSFALPNNPALDHLSSFKRSRSPKDILWRVKLPRPLGGNWLLHVQIFIPDTIRVRTDDPILHPQTHSEGQAVSLSSLETMESVGPTQPQEGVTHIHHGLLTQSMALLGSPGHTAAFP